MQTLEKDAQHERSDWAVLSDQTQKPANLSDAVRSRVSDSSLGGWGVGASVTGGAQGQASGVRLPWAGSVYKNSLHCTSMTWAFFCMQIMHPSPLPLQKEKERKTGERERERRRKKQCVCITSLEFKFVP